MDSTFVIAPVETSSSVLTTLVGPSITLIFDEQAFDAAIATAETPADAAKVFDEHLPEWNTRWKRFNPARAVAMKSVSGKFTQAITGPLFGLSRRQIVDRFNVLGLTFKSGKPHENKKEITENAFKEGVEALHAIRFTRSVKKLRKAFTEHIPGWNRYEGLNNPAPEAATRFLYARKFGNSAMAEILNVSGQCVRQRLKRYGLTPHTGQHSIQLQRLAK